MRVAALVLALAACAHGRSGTDVDGGDDGGATDASGCAGLPCKGIYVARSGNDNNPGTDVYMRRVGRGGSVVGTDLISATRRGGQSLGGSNLPGGISAYGAVRGIITFANAVGASNTLYYRNNHTGNIDDLAHAWGGSIFEVATSARANFVAFSSTYSRFRYDRNGGRQDVFFKALVDGVPL